MERQHSLLLCLQAEQECIKTINGSISEIEYYEKLGKLDKQQQSILEWHQNKYDVSIKKLPKIRKELCEKLKDYLPKE